MLVSIGPTPAAVQLFLLMFDDSDLNVLAGRRSIAYLLAAAQRAGLAVSLFHDTGQALITGVDVRVAPVRVDCAEVVQSVQHLVNLVPQIAGKTTVVRLYLSSRLPAVTTVTGVFENPACRTSGGLCSIHKSGCSHPGSVRSDRRQTQHHCKQSELHPARSSNRRGHFSKSHLQV